MARSQAQSQQQAPGQAIMKIFPIFFGFISFQMPAGLVVYFAASQMFRIAQQAWIIWLDQRKEEEAVAAGKRPKQPEETPEPSLEEEPEAPQQRGPAGGAQERPPQRSRSPQASKKRRGKKRRRN